MNPVGRFNRHLALGVLLLGSAAATAVADAPPDDTCVECHKAPSYRVENKKLYDYYQRYQSSVHGLLGVACADCHGGDPESHDADIAHVGVMEKVNYRNIPATCGDCHETQWQSFRESKHYELLKGKGGAPNCVTCHGSMDVDIYFASIVKNTCVACHNLETKNGPEIPAEAEHILSQINLVKGYKGFVTKYSDDAEVMREIGESYERVTHYWHEFDLHQVGVETEHLMRVLREEKTKAIKKKRTRE